MGLTKRSDSNTVYLQAKHYCLWRELKQPVEGSETVTVRNPKTDEMITKHGFKFDTVEGLATDLVKYDTEQKWATRYFGFKLHLRDGADAFVIDMPYQSQILRRFLRVAPSIDWERPLSITVFKGKKPNGDEEIGIWFRQDGETVKPYFTKEQPRGMPQATFDKELNQWDFREQHRWLVDRLKEETIPAIRDAAERTAPPVVPATEVAEDIQVAPDGISEDDIPPFGESW